MKIGQYCQRQRCRHVELQQFWQAFVSRMFVSDSWTFLLLVANECIYKILWFLAQISQVKQQMRWCYLYNFMSLNQQLNCVGNWSIWRVFIGQLRSCQRFTIASHSPLNISDTFEIEAWFQRTTNRKWPTGIKWSCDQWRHVTPKGRTRDPAYPSDSLASC